MEISLIWQFCCGIWLNETHQDMLLQENKLLGGNDNQPCLLDYFPIAAGLVTILTLLPGILFW